MTRLSRGAIALLALVSFPAPAFAAPTSIDATFAGTIGTMTCSSTTCTIKEKSVVCQAVGVDENLFTYSGGCTVTLEYTAPRMWAGAVSTCLGLATSGKFTIVLTGSGTTIGPVRTNVVVGPTAATFGTDPYLSLSGLIFIGHGHGLAMSVCGRPGEIHSTFAGRFSYVSAPA